MADEASGWDAGPDPGQAARAIPHFVTDPLGVLQRRWLWMVLALAVGLTATVVATLLWKPRYVAEATVLMTSQQIPEDFVRSTVRQDSIQNVNAMIGEVLSQHQLSQLIDKQGLFADRVEDTPRIDLINGMRSNILIYPKEGRRGDAAIVYALSFESSNPEEAAQVANALAALFTEASIARRNRQARSTTDFLRQQLSRDEKELKEHSAVVSDFRREHRGELPDELETSLRRLQMLSERRQALTLQIVNKENRVNEIARSSEMAPTETEVMLDEARRQLAKELSINTEEHPNVTALRSRIAHFEELAAQETHTKGRGSAVAEAEQRELAVLRKQLDDVDAESAELKERVDRIPAVAEDLAAIEQKQRVLEESYQKSLRKVEEAELAENLESAQQGGQVSLLDSAQVPTSPKLPRWMILGGGVAGSLAVALALAVLLELVDPVVVSAQQLEELAKRPVLGTIPRVA